MSNTPNNPHDSDELHGLKRQARTNALRLKIAQQNAALAVLRSQGYSDKLEGFSDCDSSNYVNYRDYLFDSPPFFGAMPTTRNDRDEGRDFPIFRTEQELAVIRGAARLITASNPIASGVLTSLTNYVIGNGFHYAALPRDTNAADIAKMASAVIEDFLEENHWSGDLDRELFQRSRIDGEYFLGLWHIGNGRVQARAVEPDQITEPSNKAGLDQWLGCMRPTNWTFGVHSDCDDAQAVHGFYVQWTNRDQDWDYLPGGAEPIIPPQGNGATWMEHAKLNVVRSVKRGLSDFYPIQGNLEIARRVLRNMGEGSAVQAAIAWIQEMAPGTTQTQVSTGTMSRADASYTTPAQAGSRTHWLQQYDPATILKVPSGQRYLPGPLGAQNAASFITAAQALLRTVAVRWNLPENFVTGTAENNNFASSLVAESPFVKFAESQQQFYAQRDRRTLQRVLWFAWLAGRFGAAEWADITRSIQITVTPPQIEVRDPEKETQVRKTLHDAGILSRKTWAAQEGLDFEQEQKNLNAETAAVRPQASPQPQGMSESFEQEVWDPAKHPRGGYDENRGWFSPTPDINPHSRAELITGAHSKPKRSEPATDESTPKHSPPAKIPRPGPQTMRIQPIAVAHEEPAKYGDRKWFENLILTREAPNIYYLDSSHYRATEAEIKEAIVAARSTAAVLHDRAHALARTILKEGKATTEEGAIMIAANKVYNDRYNPPPDPNDTLHNSDRWYLRNIEHAKWNAGQILRGNSALWSFAENFLTPGSVNPNPINLDNLMVAAGPFAGAAAAGQGGGGTRAAGRTRAAPIEPQTPGKETVKPSPFGGFVSTGRGKGSVTPDRGTDTFSIGRRDGTIYDKADLDVLEHDLLKEPKVTVLKRDQDALPTDQVGALFRPYRDGSSAILLKKDATRYEVLHELAHLKQFASLNYDYDAWSGKSRLDREQFAYDALRGSTDWAAFSPQEIKHAKHYLSSVGGNAW